MGAKQGADVSKEVVPDSGAAAAETEVATEAEADASTYAHEDTEGTTEAALKNSGQCEGNPHREARASTEEGSSDEGKAKNAAADDVHSDADEESTADGSIHDAGHALLNMKTQSREASSGEESVADAKKVSTAEKRKTGPRRYKKIAKQRIFTNPEAFLGIQIPKEALASSDDEQKFEPRRTRSSTAASVSKDKKLTNGGTTANAPNNDDRPKKKRPIIHALLATNGDDSVNDVPADSGSDKDEQMEEEAGEEELEEEEDGEEEEDARWQFMYERLKEYAENHGNTLVPYRYRKNVDEQGDRMALGTWVSQQRSRHREGNLSNRHVKKLEFIDFYWEVPRGASMKLLVAGKSDELEKKEQDESNNNVPNGRSTSMPKQSSARSLPVRRTTRKSPSKRYDDEFMSSEEDEGEYSNAEDHLDDEPDAIVASVLPTKRKRKESYKAAAAAAEAAAKSQCIIVKIKMKGGKASKVKEIHDSHDAPSTETDKSARRVATAQKKSAGMKKRFELMVRRLKEYRDIKGDCKVPYRYKDNIDLGDPVPLGLWVSRQRSKRREDPTSHTPEQLKQLDDLGFAWEVPRPIPPTVKPKSPADATALALATEESHDDALKESMRDFVRQGSARKKKTPRRQDESSTTSDDSYKKSALSTPRESTQRMKDEEEWDKMYKFLKHYKRDFGTCLVPRSYGGADACETTGEKLGQWVEIQREEYRKLQAPGEHSELTPRRKRLLTKIGFVWQLSSDIEWDDSQDEDEDDDLDDDSEGAENEAEGLVFGDEDSSEEDEGEREEPVVAAFSVKDAVALAEAGGEATKLDPPQARPESNDDPNLEACPNGFQKRWERMFQRLVQYKAQHGHCLVPYRYKGGSEPALGFWVSKQRTAFYNKRKGRKSSMSSNQIKKLDSLGFVWNPLENRETDSIPALEEKMSSSEILPSSSDETGYSEGGVAEAELETDSHKVPKENDKRGVTNGDSANAKRTETSGTQFERFNYQTTQERRASNPEDKKAQERRVSNREDNMTGPIRYHHTPYQSSAPHQAYYQSYYHGYHPYSGHQSRAPPQHPTWIPHRPPAVPTPSPLSAQNPSISGAHGSKHIVHNIMTGEQMTLKRSELSLDPNIGQTDIAEVVYYL